MKQLLKEIVKRITDNLLGKTNQSFDHGRQNGSTKNDCDTVWKSKYYQSIRVEFISHLFS